ncbi:hypothetical protein BpHYR1_011301, partial [Brachionus plicatilis]
MYQKIIKIKLQNEKISYFGLPFSFQPKNFANSQHDFGLLTNTEFKFNTTLIGFEFFAAVAGYLNIQIVSLDP